MLHAPVRRGRPKGTGIDDSDRIARLDELLRVHPEMKPTTAIRMMGYSDPSAIRRLRDKYKVFAMKARIELAKEMRTAVPVAAEPILALIQHGR
ncbi:MULTISPECIES: hypothetical protein [unclassified Hyphomicrobium]|uniref:hypothetical protein n=1 Tax=unclassified Hyphomicrobium TaxID=2619925 RepID=UPI000213E6F9|nr:MULTISPECIES: hypothetical protein [unclassified Hyphomicrobium]CCB67752.1 protein of unknown function [Hyphomicrobium sp. MC1]